MSSQTKNIIIGTLATLLLISICFNCFLGFTAVSSTIRINELLGGPDGPR